MLNIENTLVNKIYTLPALQHQVALWKAEGQKLVFTNGVFDLIHTGHITYLAQAAELGNKLIIGLNADASVKRLKGESRPVNHQDSRALLLSAFFFVDAIVIFDEDTPANLINAVMPDVLVKGGDYTIENIVGANEVMANGGEVKTINFVDGYSSTSIINKIRGQKS
ncbi:D-glycero-beta-D-manno-heptose 1-phosphate adenylyltransferase [Mucilaginibacter polytrichastri]|uniref:D-glycero-beta-D-manno-heptose 1-phosphate adenylyltransferase n=1 Tax=Mucilaginibacter polytrichastri TaxID=1302689 RepID=A0A1Q5ZUN9_9SPHI|nr:D-glycero-beta-D-manno-heptose 1-phosphate adenylyltransferase [Mucilaginibacter polytrichastri]OKS85480.1 FAD synthase [Mucilaginibacter polytrichastri]SFS38108.1 rfaE bifunctional protein, domain II [Mucilaginibacter polytrichastri]